MRTGSEPEAEADFKFWGRWSLHLALKLELDLDSGLSLVAAAGLPQN